jgi:protoporphyrinogen IX oxidase
VFWYPWVKSLHIIGIVSWFAAIFYLPRLFVYHAMATDTVSIERFKVMERKLYRAIMWPSAVITVGSGIALLVLAWPTLAAAGWLHVKLVLVLALFGYHLYCGRLLVAFARDANVHSHRFYRVLNELPVLVLIAIVVLAVVKPF